MPNLLRETIEILESAGKSAEDVLWVDSKDGSHAITWDEFAAIADIEYNNGFGGQEIVNDLVVALRSSWLERGEYDGSEWWDYCSKPERSRSAKTFSIVKPYYGWRSLAESQNEEDND